ncbi:MAG: hypothetical protein IJU23_08060 [Proteobacteria bacterium]|nr:hypothetical protein [Pseudomonadota bacterium]
MKKLKLEEAQEIALNALKEYPRINTKIIERFMNDNEWSAGGQGNVYQFTLFDMRNAIEAGSPSKLQPTGWLKEPEPLLTIYVNRSNGETFIRRYVSRYPWEDAA